MLRRDISNHLALLLAVDFDSLIQPPRSPRLAATFKWLEKKWPRVWEHLRPFLLRFYESSIEAEKAGYWLLEQGFRVTVLVRAPRYSLLLALSCEKLLAEYPNDRCHYLTSADEQVIKQAHEVNIVCQRMNVARFFTKDEELAWLLPRDLAKFVPNWLDTELLR